MISGYQIRSRHAFLKMLTGTTKKEEDQSFDNINTLLITSTILMVFSCVMEVLMYFLYNNKVYRSQQILTYIDNNKILTLICSTILEKRSLQSQRRMARRKVTRVYMSESLK